MLVTRFLSRIVALTISVSLLGSASAAPVIPGTGLKIANVGDDFEDPSWTFHPNGPKSSEEQDEQERLPTGRSSNGRWYEGIKRGYPDVVQRVPTPKGGLAGVSFRC